MIKFFFKMKIYKCFFSLLFFLITCTSFAQLYWVNQSSPVTAWLYRIVFTDTLNGWACGDSGTIVHTSNGGLNWVKQTTNVSNTVEDICFANKRLGWGISNDYSVYKTFILKTTNGGINWNAIPYSDTTVILSTVYFLDSLTGYMGGFNGTIVKTTDAGASWSQMQVDSSTFSHFPIRRFRFFNSKIGVACGGIMDFGGVLWKTTNYGLNWIAFAVGAEPIFDVQYADSMRAFATGGDFEYGPSFVKTYKNWEDWDYKTLEYLGIGYSLAIRTPKEIWVPLGFSRVWAVTIDTGKNWTYVFTSDSNSIYDAMFVDSAHGWAAGFNGRIYRYNSQIIGINPGSNIVSSFELYQNYPNPFNPKTLISYELRTAAQVRLSVFDASGRLVLNLVDKRQDAGKYKVEFSGGKLASGIYFYQLSAEGISVTKKMVLLK
jgi:photosystem II stability/assembly factor-like uncharacterized protein